RRAGGGIDAFLLRPAPFAVQCEANRGLGGVGRRFGKRHAAVLPAIAADALGSGDDGESPGERRRQFSAAAAAPAEEWLRVARPSGGFFEEGAFAYVAEEFDKRKALPQRLAFGFGTADEPQMDVSAGACGEFRQIGIERFNRRPMVERSHKADASL